MDASRRRPELERPVVEPHHLVDARDGHADLARLGAWGDGEHLLDRVTGDAELDIDPGIDRAAMHRRPGGLAGAPLRRVVAAELADQCARWRAGLDGRRSPSGEALADRPCGASRLAGGQRVVDLLVADPCRGPRLTRVEPCRCAVEIPVVAEPDSPGRTDASLSRRPRLRSLVSRLADDSCRRGPRRPHARRRQTVAGEDRNHQQADRTPLRHEELRRGRRGHVFHCSILQDVTPSHG